MITAVETKRLVLRRGQRGKRAEYTGSRGTVVTSLAMKLTMAGALCFGSFSYAQQSTQQQPSQAPADKNPELPAGAGKSTLIRVCSSCHSPDNVIANGQDRAGWEATITKMAGFGASGTDEEYTEILEYLVKNFPAGSSTPVNVNKATAAQLVSGLGFTTAEADATVKYREKNGDFKTIDDLKKVPDLDAKKLDAEKAKVAF
jgi:competence protein ComEA